MKDRKGLQALSALKGVFIWMIVLHNTFLLDALLDHIPGMSFVRIFGGSLGNSMFFMLSGFLMSMGYQERIQRGEIPFGSFLQRRLCKLYPVYALSNLTALAVMVWQYGISAINLRKIAFTFLLLQGGGLDAGNPYNSPTWFLSALFVCYILYYAGTRRAKEKEDYWGFLALGIAVGYCFANRNLEIPLCFQGNGTAYLNFFLGCALAEIYPAVKAHRRWLLPVSVAVAAGSMYLMLACGVEIISGGSAAAFAFVICPVLLYMSYEDGVFCEILNRKPLQFLGRISMGVFYWHLVLYLAMRHAFGKMTLPLYGVYLIAVLCTGVLTDRLSRKK